MLGVNVAVVAGMGEKSCGGGGPAAAIAGGGQGSLGTGVERVSGGE
jgi:hypothetical protein